MFDSMPDISYTDQMSQVIWYVHIEDTEIRVEESFINFIQLHGKLANQIAEQICDKLQVDGLIGVLWTGVYDNAATIAGYIIGVQKCILDVNPKPMFVSCNKHSVNHAGAHAASVETNLWLFWHCAKCVHIFSGSTHK